MSVGRPVGSLSAGLLSCVVMFAVGIALSTRRGEAEDASGTAKNVAAEGEPGASLVEIGGRIDAGLLRELESPSSFLLITLRGSDLQTCKDLGRQLREVRRSAYRTRPMVVVVHGDDADRVRRFLRREKVDASVRVPADGTPILDGGGAIRTPAALMVDSGYAHGVVLPLSSSAERTPTLLESLDALTAFPSATAADHSLPSERIP